MKMVLSCAETGSAGEDRVDGGGWAMKSSLQFWLSQILCPCEHSVGDVK